MWIKRSHVLDPLTRPLKKDVNFKWGDKEQEAFEIKQNAQCPERHFHIVQTSTSPLKHTLTRRYVS